MITLTVSASSLSVTTNGATNVVAELSGAWIDRVRSVAAVARAIKNEHIDKAVRVKCYDRAIVRVMCTGDVTNIPADVQDKYTAAHAWFRKNHISWSC